MKRASSNNKSLTSWKCMALLSHQPALVPKNLSDSAYLVISSDQRPTNQHLIGKDVD